MKRAHKERDLGVQEDFINHGLSSIIKCNHPLTVLGLWLNQKRMQVKRKQTKKSQKKGRWKAIQLVLKGIEWPDQLGMKRKMRELQVNLPKRKENLLCIGSKFSLVQVYFPFTREWYGLWKWVFFERKIYWVVILKYWSNSLVLWRAALSELALNLY